MKPIALIFDMDGVIIDSNVLHTEAWYSYLSKYGLSADSLLERMHGKRNDELVRDLFGTNLSEAEVFHHGAAKEALYREMMRPQVVAKLVNGLVPFLERQNHRPMGVGSNAEPANLRFVIEEAGLSRFFPIVVDGQQVTHGKPHPEIYLKVASLLEMDPKRCVVFEDSVTGIQAAQAAGARVVAVRTVDTALPQTDYSIRDFTDPGLDGWLNTLE